ncbi:hypothetical protein QFZ87_004785 [Bacillus sp. SLBN-46]|nr:hypothetical protein [Bacillus sp. SLBN-46]MDR6125188.1 hypothetical protein [Bacillus sp. SLBN-46]
MIKKENQPNEIKYSIWDTKTEENLDQMKEDLAELIEHPTKTQPQND